MTAVSSPLNGRALNAQGSATGNKTSWDYVRPHSQEVCWIAVSSCKGIQELSYSDQLLVAVPDFFNLPLQLH